SVSRFCVCWIRNTMRKVMIVVAVLITSCQVSLKPKIGPQMAQIAMLSAAIRKACGFPAKFEVALASSENKCVQDCFFASPAPLPFDVLEVVFAMSISSLCADGIGDWGQAGRVD